MKLLFYCALVGVVLSTTVTSISSTSTNVPSITLPANNDGQKTIGLPIYESQRAAIDAIPQVRITVTGTNLVGYTTLSIAPKCIQSQQAVGVTCCQAGRVLDLGATAVAPTATSATYLLTSNNFGVFTSFSPSTRLVDGGELCIATGATPGSPGIMSVGAILRTYWSCGNTNGCGANKFTDSTNVNHLGRLFSLVSTTEYASEVFGKTQPNQGQIANNFDCECVNPQNPFNSSCNGRVYDTSRFTCCPNNQLIVKGNRCPCTRQSTTTGSGGASTQCPTTAPNCCLQQKYPSLVLNTDTGSCFNPATDGCCDTGAAFNKGTQRCCPINGVQSLDIPCPCTADAHCSAGTFLNGQREAAQSNWACCVQSSPALTDTTFCNAFVNFPSGTGDYRAARCSGFCINTDYQLCCNGVACIAAYEKCCNTTCCNRFIGTCDKARRGPDFTIYETCSTIQQMNPLRAFWLFIFPAALLFATLTALALALIFANKAASREFSVTERWMIVFSVLLSILIIPLYFSPLYKYGLFMVLIAAWTILTAAVRVKFLNIVAVALYIVLFVYLFDPFTGSQFLNLAYFRDNNGITDYRSNGIWHTTKRLAEPTVNQVPTFQTCTDYFDYFRLDERLRDFRTDNYRVTTFGYCSNQYVLALYLFEGFQILCALVLTVLSLIGLVLRFRKKAADPVELEIVPQE